jgi:hypothetical protein
MMKAITRTELDLKEFLEIVLMWHCSGDIPMNRTTTCEFIEDAHFGEFMMSVQHWARRFGVTTPTRAEIVQMLHQLY